MPLILLIPPLRAVVTLGVFVLRFDACVAGMLSAFPQLLVGGICLQVAASDVVQPLARANSTWLADLSLFVCKGILLYVVSIYLGAKHQIV